MTEVEIWVVFYRGKETFRLAMVGGRSKCWSNGGKVGETKSGGN